MILIKIHDTYDLIIFLKEIILNTYKFPFFFYSNFHLSIIFNNLDRFITDIPSMSDNREPSLKYWIINTNVTDDHNEGTEQNQENPENMNELAADELEDWEQSVDDILNDESEMIG